MALSVGARRRRASQHVDDVGEQGAVSRFVTRERVEQLRGVGQCEREDQPVRLGGRERCLGCGGGGVSIPKGEVRDAGEQMRFDERERGADRGRTSGTSRSTSTAAAGSPSAR